MISFPANNLAFVILIWISGQVLERSNVNSSNTLSNFKFQRKSHDFPDCFFVWRSLKCTADTSIVSSVAIGNLIASYDQLKNCFGYIIRSYLGIPSFWWDTHWKCRHSLFMGNVDPVCSLEMSTFSFHWKCRHSLFIRNIDILFSWEMSTLSFHRKCRPFIFIGNIDILFSLEMSTFSFHWKCRPSLFIRNVDILFSLEMSTLSFH